MATLLPSTVRLRHVVFASALDAPQRRPRAIDFAPRPAAGATDADADSLTPLPAPDASRGPLLCRREDQSFLRWLFSSAGLDVRAYRIETLQRRLPACLRTVRAANTDECRELLLRRPDLIPVAISTLVIGVTSFFRDRAIFDRLRDEVLPRMIRRGGGSEMLRIWSVGCSDGPELYSIAMLLADRRVLHACHLLGTDCRRDAIERAREGLYSTAAIKGLPREYLQRCLIPEADGRWRVNSSIRGALQWRVGNILGIVEPGTWDIIFCRNMMMYLQPESARLLFKLFERILRPGGILVLGKAERPIGTQRLTPAGACMYRCDAN